MSNKPLPPSPKASSKALDVLGVGASARPMRRAVSLQREREQDVSSGVGGEGTTTARRGRLGKRSLSATALVGAALGRAAQSEIREPASPIVEVESPDLARQEGGDGGALWACTGNHVVSGPARESITAPLGFVQLDATGWQSSNTGARLEQRLDHDGEKNLAADGIEYMRGPKHLREEARNARDAPKARRLLGTEEVYDPAEEGMGFAEVLKHRQKKIRARVEKRLRDETSESGSKRGSGETSRSSRKSGETSPSKRTSKEQSPLRRSLGTVGRLPSWSGNTSSYGGKPPMPSFDIPWTPLGPDPSAANPFAALLSTPAHPTPPAAGQAQVEFMEQRRRAHDKVQRELWERFRRRKTAVTAVDVARGVLCELNEAAGGVENAITEFESTGRLDERKLKMLFAVRFLDRCEEEGW